MDFTEDDNVDFNLVRVYEKGIHSGTLPEIRSSNNVHILNKLSSLLHAKPLSNAKKE